MMADLILTLYASFMAAVSSAAFLQQRRNASAAGAVAFADGVHQNNIVIHAC